MQPRGQIALVADDHELTRAGISSLLLKDPQFEEVLEASEFLEANSILERLPQVSFLCLSLSLPGLHSLENVRSLRRSYPQLRLAVVAASARREEILSALSIGVHGYVPKTLRLAEIARALRIVMDGHIFVPPSLADLPDTSGALSAPQAGALAIRSTDLSARQREVLRLIAEGKSNKEIARALHLAEGTIKVHVSALFRHLNVRNRSGAVATLANLAALARRAEARIDASLSDPSFASSSSH